MAKNLVIVESPTKVKTIKKFLGKNYSVMASMGHVRDLPKSRLGIDTENDFEPKYITIRGKGDLLKDLRKEAKKADTVYLATDPDREGEAISWHLVEALSLPKDKYKRITFNEITKNAVKASFKAPRDIDMNLVDAQQARRVLDRIVGYEISPLLWAKVKRGLSAGRVQSVALCLICDREDEINAFIPQQYYTLDAILSEKGRKLTFTASYVQPDKDAFLKKADIDKVIDACKGKPFTIENIKRSQRTKQRPLPFTTSTLQQAANKSLSFAISRTMRVAQQLYEGVDIKGRGTVGLITYLRTDSVRIADEAKAAAREFITGNYGEEYVGTGAAPKKAGNASNIQDAHEAIRPADVTLTPAEIKDEVTRDQYRLYQLIWTRFVASQMAPSQYETVSVKLSCAGNAFTSSSSRLLFDGWESVYKFADKEEVKDQALFDLSEDSKLEFKKFDEKEHFTEPPSHFTEASLVHTMEELGIGRPSTYSPTISTLLKRRYIVHEKKAIFVTELGTVVNEIMKESFPTIVNYNFTANMESLLDGVEEGKVEWKSIIRNFYPDLEDSVKKAESELATVKIADEETDIKCEKCGRNMVIKYGPHGKFLACPGFPECRNTKPYLERIGVKCPKCGKDIVRRKTKKGRVFYGCEDYPNCDFTSWSRPIEKKCPDCGCMMVIKGQKAVCTNAECGHSENYKAEN